MNQLTDLNYLVGIDYGSKLAGTTVICSLSRDGKLTFRSSRKNEDADQMIINFIQEHSVNRVFIDAPLSLPAIYRNETVNPDYFYRKCDRALKAMSPLFLGGLTARAMQLKYQVNKNQRVLFRETYPKALKHLLELYSIDDPKLNSITEEFGLGLEPGSVLNLHHLDALMAFLSGYRFLAGQSNSCGEELEGIIIY